MLPSPSVRMRILLVDDEATLLLALEEYLSARGYEVQATSDAEIARAWLGSQTFDAVIADLRLSGSAGREGFDILRHGRSVRPAARRILLTAHDTPEIEVETSCGTVELVLHKPIPLPQLERSLATLLAVDPG